MAAEPVDRRVGVLIVVLRHDPRRAALEDGEVLGVLGERRDALHGRRAGADDADAAAEHRRLLRPRRGVDEFAAEGVQTVDERDVRHVQCSDAEHEGAGRDDGDGAVASDRGDLPRAGGVVVGRGLHPRVEPHVLTQAVLLDDRKQVVLDDVAARVRV